MIVKLIVGHSLGSHFEGWREWGQRFQQSAMGLCLHLFLTWSPQVTWKGIDHGGEIENSGPVPWDLLRNLYFSTFRTLCIFMLNLFSSGYTESGQAFKQWLYSKELFLQLVHPVNRTREGSYNGSEHEYRVCQRGPHFPIAHALRCVSAAPE